MAGTFIRNKTNELEKLKELLKIWMLIMVLHVEKVLQSAEVVVLLVNQFMF